MWEPVQSLSSLISPNFSMDWLHFKSLMDISGAKPAKTREDWTLEDEIGFSPKKMLSNDTLEFTFSKSNVMNLNKRFKWLNWRKRFQLKRKTSSFNLSGLKKVIWTQVFYKMNKMNSKAWNKNISFMVANLAVFMSSQKKSMLIRSYKKTQISNWQRSTTLTLTAH